MTSSTAFAGMLMGSTAGRPHVSDAPLKPCLAAEIWVVEDEFMIAIEFANTLEAAGVEVVGPAASVRDALDLVEENGEHLDGAILDVNLGDGRAFPIVDLLMARRVPVIFATGYDRLALPEVYAALSHPQKPVDREMLLRTLAETARR